MNRSLLNQRYVPLRKLAAGGMGEIYLARQEGMEGFTRHVVLKRIHRRLSDHPRAVQMFLDEARLAAALCHPQIVQIFDIRQEDGTYFIVMERVDGVNLRELAEATTRKGRMIPMEMAVAIISQVLEGLVHAHGFRDETGRPLPIVHRDVGPTNILISYDGAVKLADFGIARAGDTLRQDRAPRGGKVAYMAPEQIDGGAIDPRSDLFSVGVLLYELTVGQRLFRASSVDTMRRLLGEPIPPPTFARAGYPADLEIIVMRALEQDPADRIPSAARMLEELEEFSHSTGLRATRPRLGRFLRSIMGIEREPDGEPAEAPDRERSEPELDFDREELFGPGDAEGGPPTRGPAASPAGVQSAGARRAADAIRQANAAIAELASAGAEPADEALDGLDDATVELSDDEEVDLRERSAASGPMEDSAVLITDDLVEEIVDIEELIEGVEEEPETHQQPAGAPEGLPERPAAGEAHRPPAGLEPTDAVREALAGIQPAPSAVDEDDLRRKRALSEMIEPGVAGRIATPAPPAESTRELIDGLLHSRSAGRSGAASAPAPAASARPEAPRPFGTPAPASAAVDARTPARADEEEGDELDDELVLMMEDELERADGAGTRPLDDLEAADQPGSQAEQDAVADELDPDHGGEGEDLDLDDLDDDGLDDGTIELEPDSPDVEQIEPATPGPRRAGPRAVPPAVDDGLDDPTLQDPPAVRESAVAADAQRSTPVASGHAPVAASPPPAPPRYRDRGDSEPAARRCRRARRGRKTRVSSRTQKLRTATRRRRQGSATRRSKRRRN